jgi:hypothetical protein
VLGLVRSHTDIFHTRIFNSSLIIVKHNDIIINIKSKDVTLLKHDAAKKSFGVEVKLNIFLTSALDGDLLLFRSRLCHYSVGGAWWHLCFYE